MSPEERALRVVKSLETAEAPRDTALKAISDEIKDAVTVALADAALAARDTLATERRKTVAALRAEAVKAGSQGYTVASRELLEQARQLEEAK